MQTDRLSELVNRLYTEALGGKRVMLCGDSFFIGVIEKHLINRLADINTNDISLATYKPALNAHFFSGGQVIIIDFFDGARGTHLLQYVDDLNEIIVLEMMTGSSLNLFEQHIDPLLTVWPKVIVTHMEDQ